MSTLPLDQAIRANPTDFLGACVIWIPAAAWCVLLISWMVQGDMEVAPGLTFLGVVITLMVFAANPPAPGMGGLFVLAMFALVLAFPIMY
ncbi:MAG: hypothetical protein MH204_11410, partial [Fimbriimonadaceae bacterium]|nr:hypothetical protein [Fimbriimonadaceae bacterium]